MEKEFLQTVFLLEKLNKNIIKNNETVALHEYDFYIAMIDRMSTYIKEFEGILKIEKNENATDELAMICSCYNRIFNMFEDIAIIANSLLNGEK